MGNSPEQKHCHEKYIYNKECLKSKVNAIKKVLVYHFMNQPRNYVTLQTKDNTNCVIQETMAKFQDCTRKF